MLQQVIQNNPAPWKTFVASHQPGLSILALLVCWLLFLPAHFRWHWHTTHLAVFVPITELSSSLELPGFGQSLQGTLWCPSKHLGLWLGGWLVMMCIYSTFFPDLVYPSWFIIAFQNRGKKNRKHFLICLEKGPTYICSYHTFRYIPKRNKVGI